MLGGGQKPGGCALNSKAGPRRYAYRRSLCPEQLFSLMVEKPLKVDRYLFAPKRLRCLRGWQRNQLPRPAS